MKKRHDQIGFEFDDEDAEAAADLALGIVPDPETKEGRERAARLARLRTVGAKLTARSFFSDRRKKVFLTTLAETGIVSRASAAAGWTSKVAYSLRVSDEAFKTAWDNAMEFSTDALEEEARRRGQMGTDRPIYQQGRLVGYERQYSDPLLIMLLKAHRRDKFGDKQEQEVTHKGGVLVVPGVASKAEDWEGAAAANQSQHRGNSGDGSDPLK